jgi:pSer/pThr/pTyr-binding forkhead associated (FHA) protein
VLDRTGELLGLARRVDERTFAKQLTGLFLVLSKDAAPPEASRISTVRVERTGETPSPEGRPFTVVEVVRRAGSVFEDMVTVGRVEGNDIVLAHPTVSKLHACFAQDEQKSWFIVDQGSTNGTWLAGVRLKPQERQPLRGDDMIAFGERHVAVKNGRALWRFLELARRTMA